MIQLIAAIWLALLIATAIILLVLLYTDRLPQPKQPLELTELQKAAQELSDNMNALGREVGQALEPAVRRMVVAINDVAKKMR